jgi:hypothetical protein
MCQGLKSSTRFFYFIFALFGSVILTAIATDYSGSITLKAGPAEMSITRNE